MNNDASLQGIDYEKYHQLCKMLFSEQAELHINNLDNKPIWYSSVQPEIIHQIIKQSNKIKTQPEEVEIYSDGKNTLFQAKLYNYVKNPCCTLQIIMDNILEESERARHIKHFLTIKKYIQDELQLNSELNDMAGELTQRYEELNLVYGTNDQVKYFQESQMALQNLVENCVEYLEVSFAALLLPNRKMNIYYSHPMSNINDISKSIPIMNSFLFSWIRSANDSVVVNKASDPLRETVCPNIPYKLVACPIQAAKNEVVGVLLALNELNEADFTNSDRNLLLTMARKASKVIQANYDSLTGLVERLGFEYFIEQALMGSRFKGLEHTVLLIGVDETGIVSKSAGHLVGDELVKQCAKIIQKNVRDTDTVSRMSNYKFGVLLENCRLSKAQKIAEKIKISINEMDFYWAAEKYAVSLCIGVVPVSSIYANPSEIISDAEMTYSSAHDMGINNIRIFNETDEDLIAKKYEIVWIKQIQDAIRKDKFLIYSQEIQSTQKTKGQINFEILVRMKGKDGELLTPNTFIPAAEHHQVMAAVDYWMIKNTLEQISAVYDSIKDKIGFITINISGQSINNPDFFEQLTKLLKSSKIPLKHICFEITETVAVSNILDARRFIDEIRALGCTFALDDFGAGMCSFNYLKNLPVDYLKIDGKIVMHIESDPVTFTMVKAINEIAHAMHKKTIAEFVENDAILAQLKSIGIDYAQGYGIDLPKPLNELLRELNQTQSK